VQTIEPIATINVAAIIDTPKALATAVMTTDGVELAAEVISRNNVNIDNFILPFVDQAAKNEF
jgi:hypothetical protein